MARFFARCIAALLIASTVPQAITQTAVAQCPGIEPLDPAVASVAAPVLDAAEQADEGFNLGRFAWGLVKGAAIGVAVGAAAAVVVATAPAWVTVSLGVAAVGAAGYGIYQTATHWDEMSGGDKSEFAGEFIGGILTGGIGAKAGGALVGAVRGTSVAGATAAGVADDAVRVGLEFADDAARMQAAEQVLGRTLTQSEARAIQTAHEVGSASGETVGRYSLESIRSKANILRDAGFNQAERRALMEAGVAGKFRMGDRVLVPRSDGTWTEGTIISSAGDDVVRVEFPVGNQTGYKDLPMSRLRPVRQTLGFEEGLAAVNEIYEGSSGLKAISNMLNKPNRTAAEVDDLVRNLSAGIERKYGVKIRFVDNDVNVPNLDRWSPGARGNYGTWDEAGKTIWFRREVFNDTDQLLRELGHEYGAVLLGERYGGKGQIPKVGIMWSTHLLDDLVKRGGG